MKLLFLLFPLLLFAGKPIIEFIPDSRAYGYVLTDNVLEKNYHDLGHVQKLQYLLEKAGFTVRQTFLDKLPNDPEYIAKAYGPHGYKANVRFVLCWNHPYFINMDKFWAIPNEKRIGVFWEPPCIIPTQYKHSVIKRYKTIFTFRDDLVNDRNILKFCYPVLQSMTNQIIPFSEKKLACIISGTGVSKDPLELYSLRRKVIHFYEDRPYCGFDFYGRNWPANKYKNYKGSPADKSPILRQYRFSYCFENSRDISGYISEKIFDCFQAGCVPIYYGAPNITNYIPEDCFIDMRRFGSLQEAHDYISSMPEDEHRQYVENIACYLQSEEAQVFSIEEFYKKLVPLLTQ